MKVSKARLAEITRIRDAALKIIEACGVDAIMPRGRGGIDPNGSRRIAERRAEYNGLQISLLPIYGQTLNIYNGRKVLNVAWDKTGTIDVVGFHPGPWQEKFGDGLFNIVKSFEASR
jgi:hypothetical protein